METTAKKRKTPLKKELLAANKQWEASVAETIEVLRQTRATMDKYASTNDKLRHQIDDLESTNNWLFGALVLTGVCNIVGLLAAWLV